MSALVPGVHWPLEAFAVALCFCQVVEAFQERTCLGIVHLFPNSIVFGAQVDALSAFDILVEVAICAGLAFDARVVFRAAL